LRRIEGASSDCCHLGSHLGSGALKRLLLGLLVVVVILVAIGVAEAANASTRKHCTTSDRHGTMCITLYGHDLTANDVIGSFQPPTPTYLDGTAWRFTVTTSRCDPRGVTTAECAPDTTYAAPARVGTPPGGIAYGYASHGDIGVSVPWTVQQPAWVCVGIELRHGGQWVANGGSDGPRACAELRN
jgi:hypothetical protein